MTMRPAERSRLIRYGAVGILVWTLLGAAVVALRAGSRDTPRAPAGKGVSEMETATDREGARIRLPGAPPLPAALERRLLAALEATGAGYEPRTRHFDADGSPKYLNRLILERSPYLLQHAHNPVDWYPWGDEAFARAAREGKPVLLSVGYSTCHWCHVMEKESFEDEEIAAYLNRHYVAIKVDRERRPDVDAVYMTAVQTLTGGGGWPMTVWLTPDRKPFYGGTYFPPRDGDRGARVGFLTLLGRLAEIYREDPARVAASADEVTARIERSLAPPTAGVDPLAPATLAAAADEAFLRLAATFDERHGGFGGPPKFPRSVTLELLLRYHRRTGEPKALAMATRTLEAMARGGIYDHVGGGFHRYATDARWLVPHFEKMLYDNALLAVAYLEAHQATGREDFARVARETLRYVAREMTSPEGAFYSAADADSEDEEGRFFVWTPQEIAEVLGAARAPWVGTYYGVTESGNFGGRNVLHVAAPLEEVAARFALDPGGLRAELDRAREELYAARARRVPPLRDEKILVTWNGLMISAFARAAHALAEPAYAECAARAADFILTRMREGGRLARTWFAGHAEGTGYLDDYAFLAAGLLDLYEATFEPRWLREAIALHEVIEARFRDAEGGGYFMTVDDAEVLLTREKPAYDGAEPSGNSVALLSLLRLEALTTDDRYRARADRMLAAFGGLLERAPTAVPRMLAAAELRLAVPKEIVIVKPAPDASAEPLLAKLREIFLPDRVLAVAAEGADVAEQERLVPLFEGRRAIRGKVTAYVCEKRVCDLPTSDPAVFAAQIRKPPSLVERGTTAEQRRTGE
jgi:uncharacterized protein YyaL (SSP411 family)